MDFDSVIKLIMRFWLFFFIVGIALIGLGVWGFIEIVQWITVQ